MSPGKAGVVALLVLLTLSPGCITFYGDGQLEVRVLVTEDAGTTVRTDERVRVPEGGTVMDALRAAAVVETGYGGGFVEAINGVESRYPDARVDWFYHVDGRIAQVGAASYELEDGHVVVWDYRPWNRSMFGPPLLTGLDGWPARIAPNTTATPESFEASMDPGQRFARIAADGDLVILDAWGRKSQSLTTPWALAHATIGPDGSVATLVVTSDPSAAPLVDDLLATEPSGVGAAMNTTVTLEVPA